jgi:hypothetical protein
MSAVPLSFGFGTGPVIAAVFWETVCVEIVDVHESAQAREFAGRVELAHLDPDDAGRSAHYSSRGGPFMENCHCADEDFFWATAAPPKKRRTHRSLISIS